MKRIFTNGDLYCLTQNLIENPIKEDTYIPIKLNFYIQKNIETIISEYQRIEKHRIDIIKHYSVFDDKGQITIPQDKVAEVNAELDALSEIKQEVDLHMLTLDDIQDLQLSTGEFKSIMFMIEEK